MGKRNYAPKMPRPPEQWRDVPGYDGRYQASTEGNMRRRLPNGRMVPVRVYDNRGYRKIYHTVKLTRPDGCRQERPLLRVIAETWYPDQIQGRRVVHLNGLHSDNSATNVMLMTKEALMRRIGGKTNRKAVIHYRRGKIVEVYPSIVAACNATGYCTHTIVKRCSGKIITPTDDGSMFKWG